MRRADPNVVAGLIMTGLCLVLAVPVAAEQLGGGGPPGYWWALYAVFLAALVLGGWLDEWVGELVSRWLLGLLVATGAGLVLLAPDLGWLAILLVFTAALSAYQVPRRVTAAIVAVNVVVAALATGLGGAPVTVAVTAGLIYLLLQAASVLVVVALQREEAAGRRLAAANAELAAAGALLAESGRAQERLRIARELHDLVGHQLTALSLELEVASHRDERGEHVARARTIARDLLTDVRSTVGELRRREPDLEATLRAVVDRLPRPEVHLRVADGVRADERRTLAVVRCVQEIVTNAIRHADATEVRIEVTAGPDGGVRLEACDDGRGPRGPVVPGNGLRGIVERAAELGGSARYGPGPAGGFTVVAELPGTAREALRA